MLPPYRRFGALSLSGRSRQRADLGVGVYAAGVASNEIAAGDPGRRDTSEFQAVEELEPQIAKRFGRMDVARGLVALRVIRAFDMRRVMKSGF